MKAKLCKGPAHANPVWLPLDHEHWSFHLSGRRAGKPFTHCKLCRRLESIDRWHGLVPAAEVLPWLSELISRCDGVLGVHATHGIAKTTLYKLASGEHSRVQKRTAQRILSALAEQRKFDRRNGLSPRFLAIKKEQARHEERMSRLTGY